MSCENKCESYLSLYGRLEKAISQSSFVPESVELELKHYCSTCEHNGLEGTGYRKKLADCPAIKGYQFFMVDPSIIRRDQIYQIS